jgi:hypothetical protein
MDASGDVRSEADDHADRSGGALDSMVAADLDDRLVEDRVSVASKPGVSDTSSRGGRPNSTANFTSVPAAVTSPC